MVGIKPNTSASLFFVSGSYSHLYSALKQTADWIRSNLSRTSAPRMDSCAARQMWRPSGSTPTPGAHGGGKQYSERALQLTRAFKSWRQIREFWIVSVIQCNAHCQNQTKGTHVVRAHGSVRRRHERGQIIVNGHPSGQSMGCTWYYLCYYETNQWPL